MLGIFLLRFLAGASLAGTLTNWWVWGSALIWGCAVWAVYLLNGITDVMEDRINFSSRPIARGALSPRTAAFGVAILTMLSLAGAFAAGSPSWWSVGSLLALGWLCSAPPLRLKRWPVGLVVVVVPAALLTFYAGYETNGGKENQLDILVFALVMALWMPDQRPLRCCGRRSGRAAQFARGEPGRPHQLAAIGRQPTSERRGTSSSRSISLSIRGSF